ncbi:unnamed protein product [Ectocarpus sp. CCAP 1310/34]|nr:unnamed protein product [Ectocarpus sp. CCAP 1310/34]
MAISTDGFVFVGDCVEDEALQALRTEADALFNLKRSEDALTEDEYLQKGCALDFFTNNELPEDDEARTSMAKYMSRRNGRRRRRTPGGNDLHPSVEKAPPPGDSRGASRDSSGTMSGLSTTSPSCGGGGWTERHLSVVRDTIFGTLAALAWDALKAERSAAADEDDALRNPDASGAGDRGELLLFNEQYVVKPPRSSIEFGWHTDEREQLAMCVFAPGAGPPVYVSVWLALDDCDAVNGCLEVYPQARNQTRQQTPSEEDDASVVCLPAKAGDAVVFLSNLWHRSGPNQTDNPRRVFYAQYCLDAIRAAPSDPRPLSLAVPCMPSRGSRFGKDAPDIATRLCADDRPPGPGDEGDSAERSSRNDDASVEVVQSSGDLEPEAPTRSCGGKVDHGCRDGGRQSAEGAVVIAPPRMEEDVKSPVMTAKGEVSRLSRGVAASLEVLLRRRPGEAEGNPGGGLGAGGSAKKRSRRDRED